MKAVAARPLPIDDPASLEDVERPQPSPQGCDLLVRIEAVSVNPLDTKRRLEPLKGDEAPRVLGWDAAGVVEAAGPDAALFKPGDEVFYAGEITRPGCNSEFHLVDERIVGRKPRGLDFAQAAAIPLTAITAWEALFDRLKIDRDGARRGARLLVIGGAGGVGSMCIQLAKRAGLEVLATASRPESAAWVRELGADHVVDHRQPMPAQLAATGRKDADYIACCNDLDEHWAAIGEMVAPQGAVVSIVANREPLSLEALRLKSAAMCWEGMFTRSRYRTADMIEQHRLLCQVADWLDAGALRGTLRERRGPINAASLRAAHAALESGKMIGKLALAGWS